jgi:ABC-type polysaccharide/polyol phosphate transport system ATPase subunit
MNRNIYIYVYIYSMLEDRMQHTQKEIINLSVLGGMNIHTPLLMYVLSTLTRVAV